MLRQGRPLDTGGRHSPRAARPQFPVCTVGQAIGLSQNCPFEQLALRYLLDNMSMHSAVGIASVALNG